VSFTEINEKDLGKGVDQRSSEDKIQSGFWESLVNADSTNNLVSKRKGYQQWGGTVPLRVVSAETTGNNDDTLCFNLDTYIDISQITIGPIIIQGVLSGQPTTTSTTWPSGTFNSKYYNDYTVSFRLTGNSTIPQPSHGFSTIPMHSEVTQSLSQTTLDNEIFIPDVHQIQTNTSNVTPTTLQSSIIQLTDQTLPYIHYSLSVPELGTDGWFSNDGTALRLEQIDGLGWSSVGDTHTKTISFGGSVSANTHTLKNFNPIVTCYRAEKAGYSGTLSKFIPDEILVSNTGDIQIVIEDQSEDAGSPNYYYLFVISSPPASNTVAGNAESFQGPNNGVTLADAIVTENAFLISSVYTVDNVGNKQMVIPDTIEYDGTQHQITFTNTDNLPVSYEVYYDFGSLLVNQFCVTENLIPDGLPRTFTDVELDVYGIDPAKVSSTFSRESWLTHLDHYRTSQLSFPVIAQGGIFYELDTNTEWPTSTQIGNLSPRARGRIASNTNIGPAFQPDNTFARTKGYYTYTGASGNVASIVANKWENSLITILKLDTPGLVTTGTPISVGDLVTLSNMHTSKLTGEFAVADYSGVVTIDGDTLTLTNGIFNGTDNIYIAIETTVTNGDYDSLGCRGTITSYTDDIPFTPSPEFLSGDHLLYSGLDLTLEVISGVDTVKVKGATANRQVSVGLTVLAKRKTTNIPTRLGDTGTTSNIVPYDVLQYNQVTRGSKVLAVYPYANETVTLSGNTVTLSSGRAGLLREGGYISIQTEGLDSSTYKIINVSDENNFTVEGTFTSITGTLIGNFVELDEAFTWQDTIASSEFLVPTFRWKSLSFPGATQFNTPADDILLDTQVPRHLTTDSPESQEIVRSAMATDNMYLTNGRDPLLKYDGTQLSRAGFPRWEGFLNAVISDDNGGIVNPTPSITGAVSENTKFTVDVAERGKEVVYTVGQFVVGSDGETYQITGITSDTTATTPVHEIILDRTATGVTSLKAQAVVKYYARLNTVDNNGNIQGSTVVGFEEYQLDISEFDNFTVSLKFAPLPRDILYDFSNIEMELYRTKINGEVYFKVASIPIDYTEIANLNYFDTTPDVNLLEADLLSFNTSGAELATGIDQPLRAKYITSANNRSVLGNLTDHKRMETRLLDTTGNFVSTDLEGTSLTVFSSGPEYEFEWVNPTLGNNSQAITSIVRQADNITRVSFAAVPSTAPKWVYIYKDAEDNSIPAKFLGWFRVNTYVSSGPYVDLFFHLDAGEAIPSLTNLKILFPTRSQTVANEVIPMLARQDFNYIDSNPLGLGVLHRLPKAINTVMSVVPNPPVYVEGNEDLGAQGILNVTAIRDDFAGLLWSGAGNLPSNLAWFSNGARVSLSGNDWAAGSEEKTYPSRLLISFQNFPEVFDNPRAITPLDSQSVVDVDSSNGEAITGIIPFFGDSTDQDSRKQDNVVVFKENSLYVVNVTTRDVTKIDSRGVGCNSPFSLGYTENGIMFADSSGVYMLDRQFQVKWIGRNIDRLWQTVNKDKLDIVTGHVDSENKQYKLSVPTGSNTICDSVFVFDYGDESPSWSIYDSHKATGWMSIGDNSYFASIGRLYQVRSNGDNSDYRDDDQPISMSGSYRAMDFGSNKRKILRHLVTEYRNVADSSTTSTSVAVDLSSSFSQLTSFSITGSGQKISSVRHSVPRQRGQYFQVRYENSTIDEPVEITGITFHVAGLKDARGIPSAADRS